MPRSRVTVLPLALAATLTAAMAPLPSRAEPAATGAPRLVACDRALCTADGKRFPWRGVTAFALADLIADGKVQEADAFLAWASSTGFTVVRVLAMNRGWMDLSPEDGRRALPRLFELAWRHRLRVQIVALAGTRDAPFNDDRFLETQVREVGLACAAAANCVLELANEPYHSTQADLDDVARMKRLQNQVPSQVPVAWGAAARDDSDQMAGGTFAVVHLSRSGGRWSRVARVQQLGSLAQRTAKFVVDNEPIGADEQPQRSRRDNEPSAFFAQGVLARIFDVGSTFHCEDCLVAKVPRPMQRSCAAAFVAGSTAVPDTAALVHKAPGTADSPVTAPSLAPEAGVFPGVDKGRAWVVAIGQPPPRVQWQPGWRQPQRVATRPGVEVWTAVEGS